MAGDEESGEGVSMDFADAGDGKIRSALIWGNIKLSQHTVETPYAGKLWSAVTTRRSFNNAVAMMKRSAGSL